MDLEHSCNCGTEIEYSVPDDRDSNFSVSCLGCGKVWNIVNHVRKPKPMSRQERISWCIIITKQMLCDCSFLYWWERRRLKAELGIYESGRFPEKE